MEPSVLGKRKNSSTTLAEDVARAKKRKPFVIANDENVNPFITKPEQSTPDALPGRGRNVYNEARNALRKGDGKLIGREAERAKLESFLSSRLNKHKAGAIYVSGPPGSGKSAMVAQIMENIPEDSNLKRSIVNCMTVKETAGMCDKLLTDFEQLSVPQGCHMSELQRMFHAKNETHLVVLDEIDHLLEVDLDFLQKMFHWSLQKTSNLVLIGIANTLDFTERFLPRLRSKGIKPNLLPFMPYTVDQIVSVLTLKLRTSLPAGHSAADDFIPFVQLPALQLAARKVAAQTGDLRKALSICIRAIDLVESETRAKAQMITPSPSPSPTKKPLGESKVHSPTKSPLGRSAVHSPTKMLLMEKMKLSSPAPTPARRGVGTPLSKRKASSDALAQFTVETAPQATIRHMARITAVAFSNGTSSRLATLNFQQKAALCALTTLEAKHRSVSRSPLDSSGNPRTPSKRDWQPSAPTIKALHDAYSGLCNREKTLHALSGTEFREIVASLETLSLVALVDGQNGSLTPSRTLRGTPSRRGRGGGGFSAVLADEQRVASAVSLKEIRESLDEGLGTGILKSMLDDGNA
jgi:cell division control protein 6